MCVSRKIMQKYLYVVLFLSNIKIEIETTVAGLQAL